MTVARLARAPALSLLLLLPFAAAGHAEAPFLRRTPTVEAVERVGPAVVNITTEHVVQRRPRTWSGDPVFDRFFRDLFEPRFQQKTHSLGSGVLIDSNRHVITNEHVIDQADAIRVSLGDGREFEAKVVGADPNNDLAVLQVATEEELPWIPPGRSGDLMVGEPVIAIGNPFGLSNTVTTGVVSALNRSLRAGEHTYHGFLQTDASINPGNSGGPLLNAEGELIGVNTAIYGGGAQGIGFAIPIDVVKRVVRELITRGELTPVWLGLDLQDLRPSLAELLGLPATTRGALVARVRPEGPSAGGSLRRSDVITQIDRTRVDSARALYEILERSTPGQQHELRVLRDGREQRLRAVARELEPEQALALAGQLLGLELEPQPGALVVRAVVPESGAARIGFEPGDLVLALAGHRVQDLASLRRAVVDLRGLRRALVVVQRGRRQYHVNVPLS